MQKQFFVSYAREDRAAVDRLVRALSILHGNVWLDDQLHGGQSWWSEILDRIEACDAFVVAVSDRMADSDACRIELRYALDLQRPVLPVQVGPVDVRLLPPALAGLQFDDVTRDTMEAGLRLAAATFAVQQGRPLPSTAPPRPKPPFSYITDIHARVRAPDLSRSEQLALLAELEDTELQDREPEAVQLAVGHLLGRDDLFQKVAVRLERLRTGARPPAESRERSVPTAEAPQAVAAPPLWVVRVLRREWGERLFALTGGGGSCTLVVYFDRYQEQVGVNDYQIAFQGLDPRPGDYDRSIAFTLPMNATRCVASWSGSRSGPGSFLLRIGDTVIYDERT